MARVLFRAAYRKASRATYFAYLEVRESSLPGRLTPSSRPPPPDFPWPEEAGHWRFSVVPARRFLELAAEIDDIPVVRASAQQRQDRGNQLDAFFRKLTPETLDLFPRHDPTRPEFATAYRLGGWFLLILRDDAAAADEAPGLVGDGEGDDRGVSLARLQRVSSGQKRVLRKVFSLAHLVGIDEGPDGEVGGAVTPPVLDGPLLAHKDAPRARLKVIRFEAGRAPITEVRAYDYGYVQGGGDDDQEQQLVTT